MHSVIGYYPAHCIAFDSGTLCGRISYGRLQVQEPSPYRWRGVGTCCSPYYIDPSCAGSCSKLYIVYEVCLLSSLLPNASKLPLSPCIRGEYFVSIPVNVGPACVASSCETSYGEGKFVLYDLVVMGTLYLARIIDSS